MEEKYRAGLRSGPMVATIFAISPLYMLEKMPVILSYAKYRARLKGEPQVW